MQLVENIHADVADFGLPGWAYHDPAYFDIEMDRVIRPAWQIVCHLSDIPAAGDWRTLELLGESIVVVRGDDERLRAFANVCRHRAMRLVEGAQGCAKKLVCPYHAWTYSLDGRLSGVPMRGDYPALDMPNTGLFPVDLEIWQGFVFVRLRNDGGPSVAEMMAPAKAEVTPYRFKEMRPVGTPWARPRAVNWKNVGDNYSDNLHIPVAHDGLTRLFGKSYAIEAKGWVDKMSGEIADRPSAHFWERFYQTHLPRVPHLPEQAQRLWLYFKLWPNMAFDIYADQIDYMHWVPTGPTTCSLRVASYALPDDRREMKLARYANERINRVVNREDTWLIEGVQQGMESAFFAAGPIAASEVCLRNFAGRIRDIIPETCLPTPPASYRA
jgi:phenylpropionate dioxygenase-like ring-hydroxylating dioxygenase large terminal subunit